MPKPVKKKRNPPKDINQWARHMVERTTAEPNTDEPPAIPQAALSAYMAKLGAKGGKISGAKRMEMPAKQRKAIALMAARARWKKRPKS